MITSDVSLASCDDRTEGTEGTFTGRNVITLEGKYTTFKVVSGISWAYPPSILLP
jgi:hypothetical protein